MPVQLAATLCMGLASGSRTKMRLSGLPCSFEEFLLAGIYDRLSLLVWFQSQDGAKNRNRPKMVVQQLLNKQKKSEIKAYASGKDFELERQRILESMNDGN